MTTRIAKMPWGTVYKIEFADLKSSAPGAPADGYRLKRLTAKTQ
jgi:hypothetical protein